LNNGRIASGFQVRVKQFFDEVPEGMRWLGHGNAGSPGSGGASPEPHPTRSFALPEAGGTPHLLSYRLPTLFRSRKELAITDTLLRDIARLAIIGLSRRPKSG
jgi:hypothetical protein